MNSTSLLKSLSITIALCSTLPGAQAALISVAGPNSSRGAAPEIIAAPATLNNDVVFNLGQQGFDERQCVELLTALEVDGGVIAGGTLVSSHMIFMNQRNGTSGATSHFDVVWTFDGAVLGVMSDVNGTLEAASTPFLGALGSVYGAPYNSRGFEPGGVDGYSFAGNQITVDSRITQPGDWIRVITAANCPDATGLGTAILGFVAVLFAARKNRK